MSFMLSVTNKPFKLSVVMLNVIILIVITLSVIIQNVIIRIVITLSVVIRHDRVCLEIFVKRDDI